MAVMGQNESKAPVVSAKELDREFLPRHVAIIMDGNGRWAQKRGMPRTFGHKAGVEALREIIKYSDELGIEMCIRDRCRRCSPLCPARDSTPASR